MATRSQASARVLEEVLDAPSLLETMNSGQRAELGEATEGLDKYFIQCHGGVTRAAFRIPAGKFLVMTVPLGRIALRQEICEMLRDAGRLEKLLIRGILSPGVTQGMPYGEYVRVYLPGEWAPDPILSFDKMKTPGVFRLSDLQKPWMSVFVEDELASIVEDLSIGSLRGFKGPLSSLMTRQLADLDGVYFAGWCRYPKSKQAARFQATLEKPLQTRSLSRALNDRTTQMHVKSKSLDAEKAAHAVAQKMLRSRVVKNETLRRFREVHSYKRLGKPPNQRYSDVGESDMRSVMKQARNDLGEDSLFTFRDADGRVYDIPSSRLFASSKST